MAKIVSGQKVKFRCKSFLEDGSSLDDPEDNEPMELVAGKAKGNPFAVALSKAMIGMEAGQSKEIVLKPGEAFGKFDKSKVVTISKKNIESDVEIGSILEMPSKNGEMLEGEVKSIKGDKVVVDFNHALVDQKLILKLDIIR